MVKVFQIDYVRAVLDYALSLHNSIDLYDNDDIKLMSFYEHLNSDDEVERYVETYKQLVEQQNREDTIGMGIVGITSVPQITNLRTAYICPFSWSCVIRVSLENRDKMIESIYNVMENLKGRAIDIAELSNGKLVCVGTVGTTINEETDIGIIKNNDYIGDIVIPDDAPIYAGIFNSKVNQRINELGLELDIGLNGKLYCSYQNKLTRIKRVASGLTFVWKIDDDFERLTFNKYKLDISFNDTTMEQPFTLNANEYCELSFNGEATLCDSKVLLGNNIVKVGIKRYKLDGATPTTFTENYTWVEPLELPSELGTNQIVSQLRSNFFKQSSHTDSINPTIQYSFVIDESIPFIKNLYKYARYGISSTNTITPNIIYKVKEIKSSWGVYEETIVNCKLTDNISISDSENDTLTIQTTFSIEGQ